MMCKKHDEYEPSNWDYNSNGIWSCTSCSKEQLATLEEINKAVKRVKDE